jgi:hypothetical protein
MKLGFLKWPFEGVNISNNYSVYNYSLLKTKQPPNNLFSHPVKDTLFSQSTLELWIRRTQYSQKHIVPTWCDFNSIDCDALIIPYHWFLYFTEEQFLLLSKYKGKIIIDEINDPWLFDENNGFTHIFPTFLKELKSLINFENVYLLTSAKVSDEAIPYFKNKFSNVKIISSNVLMLLMSVTTRQNNKRIYSDEYIIQNFNSEKDKQFLFCSGRPRQHRLALMKFLTDNNYLDNSFVSANLAPDVGESIRSITDKYLYDIYNDRDKYHLEEFCNLDELKAYATTKIIPEYTNEYFRLENSIPQNNVYNRSKFSIISETLFQTCLTGYNFVTEKTCLPFVYGHPFILFAMSNTWQYLEELGFEQYTQFGVYDSITTPYSRFNTLCDSIQQSINEDMSKHTLDTILHNSNRFYSDDLQDSIVSSIVNQLQ